MATDATLKLLKDGLTATLEFKEKELITRTDWGKSTFNDAEVDLDQIFGILSTLSLLPQFREWRISTDHRRLQLLTS